jgi:hypothetical protein
MTTNTLAMNFPSQKVFDDIFKLEKANADADSEIKRLLLKLEEKNNKKKLTTSDEFNEKYLENKQLNFSEHQNKEEINDTFFEKNIKFYTECTWLNLDGCPITDKTLQLFSENCPSLKELGVSNCFNITPQGLEYLKKLPLNQLDLSNLKWLDNEKIKRIGTIFPNVEMLSLSGCPITDEALDLNFKDFRYLNDLVIKGCTDITNIGLEKLSNSKFKLIDLDISNLPKVDDKGIGFIVEAFKNTLENLDISRDEIWKEEPLTNNCLNSIGELLNLKKLNLNNINFKCSAETVLPLFWLKNLEELIFEPLDDILEEQIGLHLAECDVLLADHINAVIAPKPEKNDDDSEIEISPLMTEKITKIYETLTGKTLGNDEFIEEDFEFLEIQKSSKPLENQKLKEPIKEEEDTIEIEEEEEEVHPLDQLD